MIWYLRAEIDCIHLYFISMIIIIVLIDVWNSHYSAAIYFISCSIHLYFIFILASSYMPNFNFNKRDLNWDCYFYIHFLCCCLAKMGFSYEGKIFFHHHWKIGLCLRFLNNKYLGHFSISYTPTHNSPIYLPHYNLNYAVI